MSLKLKLDTDCKKSLSLHLYKGVKNAAQLKEMIVSGKLNCCIIKPSLIIDPLQVVVAANKAAVSEMQSSMTTKSRSTEILYNLSNSKNISQSLMKFGISDNDEIMLVGLVYENEDEHESVLEHFQGELVPIEELKNFSDVPLIKKTYKIKDIELSASSLVDLIVTRIVTRDFV